MSAREGGGDSLQATYKGGPHAIPAGTWALSGDSLVQGPATVKKMQVRWDIVLRPEGGAERVLRSFEHSYQRDPAKPNNAVAYTGSGAVPAVSMGPADQLLLRMTVVSGDAGGLWAPNGDGTSRNGVIPHIDLPR